jgi:hypothetical protein
MNETATRAIEWILGISLFMIFAVPAVWWLIGRAARNKRRRLERSRREIMVASAPDTGGAECPHKRSKSRARTDEDGRMRSICRFCGIKMIRHGPGDWEALAPEQPASRG